MIRKGGMIGKAGFFRCVTVLRCVLYLAQCLCNFCQKPPGISQIRRTHAFARFIIACMGVMPGSHHSP